MSLLLTTVLVSLICTSRHSAIILSFFNITWNIRISKASKLLVSFSFWLEWRQSFPKYFMNSWVYLQMWNNKNKVSYKYEKKDTQKNFLYNVIFSPNQYSHKKRKDSVEGSLDGVLFLAELEFSKIMVPSLPQHTSNVNNEWARKSEWSKQLYYLYVNSFLEHWHTFNFLILILICF